MNKHLWEVEHPYYCAEGNYHDNGYTSHHGCWADFLAEMGEADEDMNLVFRWDWRQEDGDVPGTGTLQLCYMQQRRGCYATHFVSVVAEDEPVVREWLTGKAKYFARLWAPLEVCA